MTTIYLEVDGQPHPAKDIVWLEIAPCGCICGVSSINQYEIFTDGEAAFHSDDSKPVREKYIRLGFTFQAVTTAQYRAVHTDRFRKPCTCTPQWGVDPIPVPDGWTWMTTDSHLGRTTHRRHLVPAGSDTYQHGVKPPALCGVKNTRWNLQDRYLNDTAECTNCEKQARATSPVLVDVGGTS